MFELKEPKKTFRSDGTLSHEVVELPDGTSVSITYDKTGTKVLEKKEIPPYTEIASKEGKCISRYRKDGTLWLVRECDEKGQWTATEYDKEGKCPICRVFESKPVNDETGKKDIENALPIDKIRQLVSSAELLSRKRKKYPTTSIQQQRGE